jgi:hypothetical protein
MPRLRWWYLVLLLTAGTAWGQPAAPDSSVAMPSPRGAMLRSIVLPGWGQWYNGRRFKAALAAGTEWTLIGMTIYEQRQWSRTGIITHETRRNNYQWFLGLAIMLSMTDAYVDAYLHRFDEQLDIHAWADPTGPVGVRIGWLF